jgi:hypothetical protein
MEFDTWSMAFKRQNQIIQEENGIFRGSTMGEVPKNILDNSILNESIILANGNISQLKNIVNDDDSRSLA